MANTSVRPPAVAGLFYPAEAQTLSAQLQSMLSTAVALDKVYSPKAFIVPHAAYLYSGPIAATAYRALAPLCDVLRKVVILGPTHRIAVDGFALPAAQAFATPLGAVPLCRSAWEQLQQRPDIVIDDRPHAQEHCLEVQLPFLQTVLGAFELVPILVGRTASATVADLIEQLWGGPETLILVSSDLSHYLSYEQARHCDRATVAHILRLQEGIAHHQACGATAINGLLRAAARHGLAAHLLDLRNSGDTAGERSQVVGYASIAFCESIDDVPAARH